MDYQSVRKHFGKRVHDLRRARNIKQEKLAERIGKSIEHISYIERGERSPSFEVIIDLADAFGITPTDLFNFDSTDQLLSNTSLSVVSPNSVVDPIEGVCPFLCVNGKAIKLEASRICYNFAGSLQE